LLIRSMRFACRDAGEGREQDAEASQARHIYKNVWFFVGWVKRSVPVENGALNLMGTSLCSFTHPTVCGCLLVELNNETAEY